MRRLMASAVCEPRSRAENPTFVDKNIRPPGLGVVSRACRCCLLVTTIIAADDSSKVSRALAQSQLAFEDAIGVEDRPAILGVPGR
jgi:hypothetical protein